MANNKNFKLTGRKKKIVGTGWDRKNALTRLRASMTKQGKAVYAHALKLLHVREAGGQKTLWDSDNFNSFESWAKSKKLIPYGYSLETLFRIAMNFEEDAFVKFGTRMILEIDGRVDESKQVDVVKHILKIFSTSTSESSETKKRADAYDHIRSFAKSKCATKNARFEAEKKKKSNPKIVQSRRVEKLEKRIESRNETIELRNETIERLREENKDLRKENAELKVENSELKGEVASLQNKIISNPVLNNKHGAVSKSHVKATAKKKAAKRKVAKKKTAKRSTRSNKRKGGGK